MPTIERVGMSTDVVASFATTLETLEVGVTRVAPADVAAAIDAVVRAPAVGVPIGIEGAALPASVTVDPTVDQLRAARTGVTPAALGVADYGSILLAADAAGTELASLFIDLHVAILPAAAVVADMRSAFAWLGPQIRERGTSAIVATGPSATADMGGLVRGAHGPAAVHVVLVEGGADEQ
jgi:L-lactate dehydrogenase complex protein LldG